MIEAQRYEFVLAIYLNSRGFAFVLFQGHLAPLDWSVRELRGPRKYARCLAKIVGLLDLVSDSFPTVPSRA